MMSMIVIIDNTITAADRDALLDFTRKHDCTSQVDIDVAEGKKFKVFEVWLFVVSVTKVIHYINSSECRYTSD